MDVYLIPVGPAGSNRYEMYCEEADDDPTDGQDLESGGWFSGLLQKFRASLARVENERLNAAETDQRPKPWMERMKDRGLSWIAERIAEQRLLWGLRKQAEAQLFYPDDLTQKDTERVCRTDLQREADRHLKWLIIDAILFTVSGVFFWIPGPNVLAYYFGFRMVGHYLSRRGAKHALTEVRWSYCPSAELSQLRRAISLAGQDRDREVHEVASRLRLEHLAKFVERVAIEPA